MCIRVRCRLSSVILFLICASTFIGILRNPYTQQIVDSSDVPIRTVVGRQFGLAISLPATLIRGLDASNVTVLFTDVRALKLQMFHFILSKAIRFVRFFQSEMIT